MIVHSFSITVTVPEWLYVCMDLDLMDKRLDTYIGDKKMDFTFSGLNNTWDLINYNSLQLQRISVHNEKAGLINLFSESFRPGTCGQNGSLLAWPVMFSAMQPRGHAVTDLSALCGADKTHLVFVPLRTSFNSALDNCNKIKAGSRFPVYSSLEARGIIYPFSLSQCCSSLFK